MDPYGSTPSTHGKHVEDHSGDPGCFSDLEERLCGDPGCYYSGWKGQSEPNPEVKRISLKMEVFGSDTDGGRDLNGLGSINSWLRQ